MPHSAGRLAERQTKSRLLGWREDRDYSPQERPAIQHEIGGQQHGCQNIGGCARSHRPNPLESRGGMCREARQVEFLKEWYGMKPALEFRYLTRKCLGEVVGI